MSLSDQVRIARHLMNRSKTKGTSCDEEGVRKKKKNYWTMKEQLLDRRKKRAFFVSFFGCLIHSVG